MLFKIKFTTFASFKGNDPIDIFFVHITPDTKHDKNKVINLEPGIEYFSEIPLGVNSIKVIELRKAQKSHDLIIIEFSECSGETHLTVSKNSFYLQEIFANIIENSGRKYIEVDVSSYHNIFIWLRGISSNLMTQKLCEKKGANNCYTFDDKREYSEFMIEYESVHSRHYYRYKIPQNGKKFPLIFNLIFRPNGMGSGRQSSKANFS